MDNQLHVLDAKKEYMNRLSTDIAPFIESHFKRLYQDAVAEKKSKALFLFQQKLKQIPLWNEQDIQTLTTTIQNALAIKRNAKSQYLSSLIAMAFVSFLKIMSSCRLNQQKKPPQMRLKLPTNNKFIHRCFVEAARLYYEDPHTIRRSQEKQLEAITKAVETAVRELIPLEDILDVYLQDCVDDSKTVPPILSPVQSDDEEESEDANDDAFPMAFSPDAIQDDGEEYPVNPMDSIPTQETFSQPTPRDHQTQGFAPAATNLPIPTGLTSSHPGGHGDHSDHDGPRHQAPPPSAPEQRDYSSEIPTAYQYRQQEVQTQKTPPPSPNFHTSHPSPTIRSHNNRPSLAYTMTPATMMTSIESITDTRLSAKKKVSREFQHAERFSKPTPIRHSPFSHHGRRGVRILETDPPREGRSHEVVLENAPDLHQCGHRAGVLRA